MRAKGVFEEGVVKITTHKDFTSPFVRVCVSGTERRYDAKKKTEDEERSPQPLRGGCGGSGGGTGTPSLSIYHFTWELWEQANGSHSRTESVRLFIIFPFRRRCSCFFHSRALSHTRTAYFFLRIANTTHHFFLFPQKRSLPAGCWNRK